MDLLKRKIEQDLIKWKNTKNHKPLIVKGCRQCGKTYSVKKFAEENYKYVVYINFFSNPDYVSVFSGSLEVDNLTMMMSAVLGPNVMFVPNETVIILDEIQECPEARTALKFFKTDGRYDVIGTGSLLGVKGYGKEPKSVPVGYETVITMYPLDFEEFLWAKGIDESVISELKRCYRERTPVSEVIHNSMLRNFREYICVGGLPYVVDRFLATNDMNVVYAEQRDIIEEYKDDFGKHLDENEREEIDLTLLARINRVFDSIPAQLAKENKKFTYAQLEKKGRAENYQAAIQWLFDAGIINICYNLSNISLPFEGNKIDNIFKIYMQDSGLFVAMLEQGSSAALLNGDFGMYKGAIYENIIADAFSKMNRPLYYYHKESGLEIDFITKYQNNAVLVEVKATNGNAKSANTILKNKEQYNVNLCIKYGDCNVGQEKEKLALPYYMAFMLE